MKRSKTGRTGSTYITSHRSDTMRKSMLSEYDSSTSIANNALELSAVSPNGSVVKKNLCSIAEETVIENQFADNEETNSQANLVTKEELDYQPEPEQPEPEEPKQLPDFQVPPYIFARLQGPYYPPADNEKEDSFPDLSADLTQLTQTEFISDESDSEELTRL